MSPTERIHNVFDETCLNSFTVSLSFNKFQYSSDDIVVYILEHVSFPADQRKLSEWFSICWPLLIGKTYRKNIVDAILPILVDLTFDPIAV